MATVILFALLSTMSAAVSTVLKHVSANRPVTPVFRGRAPQTIERMIANPLFLAALAVDVLAVGFQILALRYGDLSTVQPVLTLVLVFSLALDHVVARSRMTHTELLWAGTLIAGLTLFLVSSGATHPAGGHAVGERNPGMVLAALAVVAWGVLLYVTRHHKASIRARVMAMGVAAIYASAAALIKSSTRILDTLGLGELVQSWQLWVLLAVAGFGLVLNQHAFSMAPLHVSLPVIASLDPLFSIVIGRAVFGERLLSNPAAVIAEVVGLAMLLLGVVRLSRSRSVTEAGTHTPVT